LQRKRKRPAAITGRGHFINLEGTPLLFDRGNRGTPGHPPPARVTAAPVSGAAPGRTGAREPLCALSGDGLLTRPPASVMIRWFC
jgi:hypothetical protein